jgi:hypothetical protein
MQQNKRNNSMGYSFLVMQLQAIAVGSQSSSEPENIWGRKK